jgi:hypothetical protein
MHFGGHYKAKQQSELKILHWKENQSQIQIYSYDDILGLHI